MDALSLAGRHLFRPVRRGEAGHLGCPRRAGLVDQAGQGADGAVHRSGGFRRPLNSERVAVLLEDFLLVAVLPGAPGSMISPS